MNNHLEITSSDEGRIQKKVWITPVLIIADVSITGAKVNVTEAGPLGPAS